MTSAYPDKVASINSVGSDYAHCLPYVPLEEHLNNGATVTIDFICCDEDVAAVQKLMNDVIRDGMSWPFEEPLTELEFRSYFFSHTALVARNNRGDVIGAFYCKPNFPGRCSHFCNGGFITDPDYRKQGVASAMGRVFLRIAKDLGFKAVFFNLVFTSNKASIRLWDKLGFTRLARLPRVGRLREGNFDAVQYYYDLDDKNNQCRNILRKLRSTLPSVCVIALAFLAGRFSASRCP